MNFEERHSLCQMSVHSADKSQCVIAALVMLANKGTTVQDWPQRYHHLPKSRVFLTSTKHWVWCRAGQDLLSLHPPLLACLRGRPPPLLLLWVAVAGLRSFCVAYPAHEGQTGPPHCCCVTIPSLVLWEGWQRHKEEEAYIWDDLPLNPSFGVTSADHCVWNEAFLFNQRSVLKTLPYTFSLYQYYVRILIQIYAIHAIIPSSTHCVEADIRRIQTKINKLSLFALMDGQNYKYETTIAIYQGMCEIVHHLKSLNQVQMSSKKPL